MSDEVTKAHDLIKESGLLAIKTLITLNAGALIVMVTFLGSSAEFTSLSLKLEPFIDGMFFFLGGIVTAFVAIFVSYVAAQFRLADKHLPCAGSVTGFLACMILPSFGSLAFFVAGFWLALGSIGPVG